MVKNENAPFHKIHQGHPHSVISDYPDRISDECVRLTDAKVIPDVIDNVLDTVSFTAKFNGKQVTDGQHLRPSEAAEEPEIAMKGSEATFTLLMVDPDAPSPHDPKYRNWLHWMVVNIPGVDTQRGDVIVDYMGPSPLKGRHRYVLLLFKQSGRMDARAPHARQSFTVRDFARGHGLGDPVAAQFFWAEPE
ncbi:hypothetical protein WJX81_000276 [Elliptochloris bilobata]|uniref:Uncharacterized protein n=1 Tax=Elliptochloris bilobata TaxID=381761 RepID=A0AAW1SDM8_9CHLO